jgi:hypothetical protein
MTPNEPQHEDTTSDDSSEHVTEPDDAGAAEDANQEGETDADEDASDR